MWKNTYNLVVSLPTRECKALLGGRRIIAALQGALRTQKGKIVYGL